MSPPVSVPITQANDASIELEGRELAVLVIEDEPLIRAHIRDVLEQGGYRVEEAGTSDQAFEMLEDGFAAVIADIELPGDFDGVDLAWAAHSGLPKTGTVLVSGKTRPSPGSTPPKTRFVPKPIDDEALLQAVREVVEARGPTI